MSLGDTALSLGSHDQAREPTRYELLLRAFRADRGGALDPAAQAELRAEIVRGLFVQALGILFLFGRNGVINRTFDLGIDPYGFWGIVVSDVFYSLPHAYLILSAALAA